MTRSILVVDDDADVRLLLRQRLGQEGFVVQAAHDGQQALHLLDKIDPPVLILLDYSMPTMDGKHVLAAIRQHEHLRAIPVILLSARTREWSGARLDVAHVLMKPVDPDLLVSTVRAICGVHTVRRSA